MMWFLLIVAFMGLLISPVDARPKGPPMPDMLTIDDSVYGPGVTSPSGAARDQAIAPLPAKTLVIISAGQSNWENITPTLYTPVNFAAVDAFSIYTSGSYAISGAIPGPQQGVTPPQGPGVILARLADNFVTDGIFSKVIVVGTAIGGTSIANWATSVLYNRVCVAIERLARRGITPSTPGVTFAFIWGQGESDTVLGTGQAAYTASWNSILGSLQACGLLGFRSFVIQETWYNGTTSAPVRAAQAAAVNGVTVFSGGDLDTINATGRNPDNVHFNDTGAANAATIVGNAMRASGPPF